MTGHVYPRRGPSALPPTTRMRRKIDKGEILARAREGLALNLKELSVAAGYGYSTVRGWHYNGMPLLDGKITRSEALAWRKKYEKSKPVESLPENSIVLHHPLLAAGKSGAPT